MHMTVYQLKLTLIERKKEGDWELRLLSLSLQPAVNKNSILRHKQSVCKQNRTHVVGFENHKQFARLCY